MDFWRGEAYTKFFEHLDSKGGFYYEVRTMIMIMIMMLMLNFYPLQRWGDAPVHSIAAALFQSKDKIHFFDEIGYEHNPYTHCPKGEGAWTRGKCDCDQKRSFGGCSPVPSWCW